MQAEVVHEMDVELQRDQCIQYRVTNCEEDMLGRVVKDGRFDSSTLDFVELVTWYLYKQVLCIF